MKLSTMQIVNSVSEITPSLYLTSAYGASRENIERRGITLVVNCAQELHKQDHGPHIEVYKVNVDDTPYAPIHHHFDSVADKIHEHVHTGGRALVHCLVGVSRSTTLLLAYLMKHRQMSLKSAFDLVSSRRSVVRPNPGFWQRLIEYEKKLISFSTPTLSNHYTTSKHTEIPIHITSRSSSPDLLNSSSSGFITRPFSSATSHSTSSPFSPSSLSASGGIGGIGGIGAGSSTSRHIPISHYPTTPSSLSSLTNHRFNDSLYGLGGSSYTNTKPTTSKYSTSLSSTPLLDKYRKNSYLYDTHVPVYNGIGGGASGSSINGSPFHSYYNDGLTNRFDATAGAKSSTPYSTTYRSSYGRF